MQQQQQQLQGNKCTLVTWQVEFAEAITFQANNPKIAQNLLDFFPHPYNLKDALDWVQLTQAKEMMGKHFCICVAKQGILCPIGGIGVETPHLGHPNKSGTVLLGYWLGEEYWGQGIATDAVNIMLNYIFSEEFKIMVNQGSQVGRIEATIFDWNEPSGRVLQKCGFKNEGRLEKCYFKRGRYVDGLMYAKVNPLL